MKPLTLLIGTFVAGVLLILGAYYTLRDAGSDNCGSQLCGWSDQ